MEVLNLVRISRGRPPMKNEIIKMYKQTNFGNGISVPVIRRLKLVSSIVTCLFESGFRRDLPMNLVQIQMCMFSSMLMILVPIFIFSDHR